MKHQTPEKCALYHSEWWEEPIGEHPCDWHCDTCEQDVVVEKQDENGVWSLVKDTEVSYAWSDNGWNWLSEYPLRVKGGCNV